MTKIFLPPIDSRWRFTTLWTPSSEWLAFSHNSETLWGGEGRYGSFIDQWKKATGDNTNGDAHGPGGWLERLKAWETQYKLDRGAPEFAAGTVIQIERYHVSRSGENDITIKMLVSPDPLLTPKKRGGKMRGAGRLYLCLADFNSLPELEEVTDDLA